MKNKTSKKQIILALIILFGFYGALQQFKKNYYIGINESNSVDGTIFLISKDTNSSGKYLVFLYEGEEYHQYKKGKKFIKKIACYPGQKLTFTDNNTTYDYYCDNKFIAKAKKKDSSNLKLPHFAFTGVIPKQQYFMVGTHEKSFDSRYWGFVNQNKITGKAVKLW